VTLPSAASRCKLLQLQTCFAGMRSSEYTHFTGAVEKHRQRKKKSSTPAASQSESCNCVQQETASHLTWECAWETLSPWNRFAGPEIIIFIIHETLPLNGTSEYYLNCPASWNCRCWQWLCKLVSLSSEFQYCLWSLDIVGDKTYCTHRIATRVCRGKSRMTDTFRYGCCCVVCLGRGRRPSLSRCSSDRALIRQFKQMIPTSHPPSGRD